MSHYQFSEHALCMLYERKISKKWVQLTLESPLNKEYKSDGTLHYIRPIEENGGRYLRVVTSQESSPDKIITVFFDRRLGRKK